MKIYIKHSLIGNKKNSNQWLKNLITQKMPKQYPAFLLSEAMVGLVIMAMIISLIVTILPTIRRVEPINEPRNISWQRLLENLEKVDDNPRWIDIKDGGHELVIRRFNKVTQAYKEYIIKQTRDSNRLYLSGEYGGFMPLLANVDKILFQAQNGIVSMEVVFLDGEKKSARLAIPHVSK